MTGTTRIRAAVAVGVALGALGCAAVMQQLVIGEWRCTGATPQAIDSLTIYSWGEITVTHADGQGARGVWTIEGSTLTFHHDYPRGSDDFTYSGGQILGPDGEVCAKTG